jgi:diguanylate cyclase (GGDEF)-like protein
MEAYMKIIRRAIVTIVLLGYFAATIMNSDFWGNILSPIITFETFIVVYKAFYLKQKKGLNRSFGLFLSFSILAWTLADILWAVADMAFHIDPEEVYTITVLYTLVNVFLAASMAVYIFQIFRRWNIIQILLDTVVMSYLVLNLVWVAFLNEDFKNVLLLRSDWTSMVSIVLDVLVAMWIVITFISVRAGRMPLHMRFVVLGAFFYCLIDLEYFYEYFFETYNPNSILDAAYIIAFRILAVAAMLKLDKQKQNGDSVDIMNTGRSFKSLILLLAPVILIIFEGFNVVNLLMFMTVILFYYIFSTYIQNNIYKEGLLKKEKENNLELELKVKARTEELEVKNRELQNLINRDFVTGLYSRRYLLDYLEGEIDNIKPDETIVLLYIDVNRYKMISTMFGHYVGEKVLHELAERLKPIEDGKKNTILAHYGDDAYIFAATGRYDYEQGDEFAQEAIRLCSNIYQIDEYQFRITVNIGISIFPFDAIGRDELIKHADVAMTQARLQGFNMINEFDLKLSEVFFRRNTIEILLKKVNFRKEFYICYQPELQTDSRKIIGFEALLRWNSVTGEAIGPTEFIPIAEETGYIIPIGNWVMKMVLRQLADWNSRFHEKIMIGINVSLKQLNSLQFIERLKEELSELQIEPEWVDLEITESLQLQENPDVVKMVEDIRSLGIRISIDDFGTGYSSLSYFKNLPADRIKLAKGLVDYVHVDDFDYQLVKSIIMLSKAKGIKVIAEGVETREQWETLRELECDEVQGFFFGRPVTPEEIEAVYGDVLMGYSNQ